MTRYLIRASILATAAGLVLSLLWEVPLTSLELVSDQGPAGPP